MINREGSSLIVTLLVISFAGLMIKTAWSIAAYAMDIALLRAQEQRMLYAANGVINKGIKIAQDNFDLIITNGNLVSSAGTVFDYKTLLELQPSNNQNQIQIKATVSDLKNYRKTFLCFIAKKHIDTDKSNSFFTIDQWQES